MPEDAQRAHTNAIAFGLANCVKVENCASYESVQDVGGIKYRVRVELDDGADLGDWKPYGGGD